MSRQVTAEDAYREACQALGEAVVMQRLMSAELSKVTAERDALAVDSRPED